MRLLVILIVVMIVDRAKVCLGNDECECRSVGEDVERRPGGNQDLVEVVCRKSEETSPTVSTNNVTLESDNVSLITSRLFRLKIQKCYVELNVSDFDLNALNLSAFNASDLRSLDLSSNGIRVVEDSSFAQISSLEVLNLSDNVIDALAVSVFDGLSKLQHLDISSNKLTAISSDVFLPLSSLQHLNLSNNLLQALDEACLSGLQRLQQLDVSWNRLARVAPGSLRLPSLSRLLLAGNPALGSGESSLQQPLLVGPGKRLQTVDASRTGLKRVPAALTHSIRTLRLAGNSIGTVSRGHLDSYPLLQLLDFTSNELELIEDDALGRLEVLSILYLSDNKLRLVPRDLPERLKILHLERNRIERLSPEDLHGLPYLEVLLLTGNRIGSVRDAPFAQLDSIVALDLSNNPIKSLPAGSLSAPSRLRVVRLAKLKNLAAVDEEVAAFPVSSPEHLVTLDMSDSPVLGRQFLADTAALAASKELQELDLSGDGIRTVRSDLLHYLPQLRTLRLANNSLNCGDLNWLAAWMRRQDQPESRSVTCVSPAELSGCLLIDLEDVPTESETSTVITTTSSVQTTIEVFNETKLNDLLLQDSNDTTTPKDDLVVTTQEVVTTHQHHEQNWEIGNNVTVSHDDAVGVIVAGSEMLMQQREAIQAEEPSTFSESNSVNQNDFKNPDSVPARSGTVLVLFAGILGVVNVLAVMMCTVRRRLRGRRISFGGEDDQRDHRRNDIIEVNSLPNVTELW